MSRLQTLRMIACMLLMGVVAIAAYLFKGGETMRVKVRSV